MNKKIKRHLAELEKITLHIKEDVYSGFIWGLVWVANLEEELKRLKKELKKEHASV